MTIRVILGSLDTDIVSLSLRVDTGDPLFMAGSVKIPNGIDIVYQDKKEVFL